MLALGDDGAVAASVQQHGDARVGSVKLIAVRASARRKGYGRRLLEAAHHWALQRGVSEMRAGASAPFYIWPGVDVNHTAALCLFESAGYNVVGGEVNMTCSTSFRADAPDGIVVQRAIEDATVKRVMALVQREWPWWLAETQRAIEHGCCHAALAEADASGDAVGFACHSVNRAGWVGPMGTDPRRGRSGVGAALLGQVCRDLMIAEFDHAEIAWVGPVSFYAKAAGATVSRSFRSLSWRPA